MRGSLYQRVLPRVLLLIIVGAGAWLRLYHIGSAPPGLYRDEAFYGLDALNVLRGQFALFFAANNGREGLFIYLLSLGIAALGRTPEALRIVSASVGIVTLLAIYAAGQQMFSQRIGLLAAGIMATLFWHVAISRVAFRAITLPLMLCLTAACFFASQRSLQPARQRLWALLAGVCFGLVFYTYTSGQFILPLLLVYALWQLALRWVRPSHVVAIHQWRWMLLGAVVTLAPFVLWLTQHSDLYFARAGQVSILSPGINHGDMLGTLLGNIAKALLMFTHTGDRIWRHNLALRPAFDSLLALAFVIGVALCAWAGVRQLRMKNEELRKGFDTRSQLSIPNSQFFLFLWLLVFLVPTILAEDTPHFLRAIGALPAACLLAAVGLEAGLAWLSRRGWLMITGIIARRISPPALVAAALIVYSGYRTYDDYFRVYVNEPLTGYWLERQNVALANTVNTFPDTIWLQDSLLQDNAALRFLSPRIAQGNVNFFHLEGDQVQLQANGPISGLVVLDPNQPWGALRGQLPNNPLRIRLTEGAMARGDLDPGPRRAFITLAITNPEQTNATTVAPLQRFDPNIVLQRATWDNTAISNSYDLALTWQVSAAVSEDYAVFVHWLRGGRLIAQSDHSAALGYWPMPEWRLGDMFDDHHQLTVPGGTQPGDEIRVGLYRRADGVRLRAIEAASEWVIIPPPR